MPFPDYVSDTNNLTLTSISEIQRLFSTSGIALHVDDLNPDDENFDENNDPNSTSTNFLTELCQRATSHIMSRLAPRYKIENIYQIPRLREIATYWAAYKLTRRRGNEPVYEEEYIEAMDELDAMRRGELFLNAPSNGQRTYVQSVIVDLRYNQSTVRVLPGASSAIVPNQNIARFVSFAWL